jgi:hypothetical protein
MGRVLLTVIVPLLLPTVLYMMWRALPGRSFVIPAAWFWLLLAGAVLASLTLVIVSIDFGAPRNGTYVPPHVDSEGRVVPGRIAPAQNAE